LGALVFGKAWVSRNASIVRYSSGVIILHGEANNKSTRLSSVFDEQPQADVANE
jgi:hypothetical protein